MMDYFSSVELQSTLQAAAARWRGTPFMARTQICQGGVDCVNLISALMRESGVAHDFHPPDYSLDWGRHANESQLLSYLRSEPLLRELPDSSSLLPGDILTFQAGGVEHHAGVSLGSFRFIHTTMKLGTVYDLLAGAWLGRLSSVFRIGMEVA